MVDDAGSRSASSRIATTQGVRTGVGVSGAVDAGVRIRAGDVPGATDCSVGDIGGVISAGGDVVELCVAVDGA